MNHTLFFHEQDSNSSNSSDSTSEQTPTGYKFLLISVGLLGLTMNAVTMIVIVSYKPFSKCFTYIYIFALSASDFASSLLLCLMTLFEYHGEPLDQHSIWHILWCKLWCRKGILWASISGSIYMILAVALERCVAVTYPIFYKSKFSKKKIYPAVILGEAFYSSQCRNTS